MSAEIPAEHERRRSRAQPAMSSPAYRFHFSLGRMLVLMAAVGAWLAGFGRLPAPWVVWLGTAVFYLGVVLCFSAESERAGTGDQPSGE